MVRADIVREYWYIREDPKLIKDGICIDLVFTLDLKMDIPKALLDTLLTKQAGSTIDLLIEKYKDFQPKPKLWVKDDDFSLLKWLK